MSFLCTGFQFSQGLNLNLSSVGGRSLKLTDYYRAEARRYLPDRAKTEAETTRQSRGRGSKVETEARPCEAEARPSQLKKTASRPPGAEADASKTTSLENATTPCLKNVAHYYFHNKLGPVNQFS